MSTVHGSTVAHSSLVALDSYVVRTPLVVHGSPVVYGLSVAHGSFIVQYPSVGHGASVTAESFVVIDSAAARSSPAVQDISVTFDVQPSSVP